MPARNESEWLRVPLVSLYCRACTELRPSVIMHGRDCALESNGMLEVLSDGRLATEQSFNMLVVHCVRGICFHETDGAYLELRRVPRYQGPSDDRVSIWFWLNMNLVVVFFFDSTLYGCSSLHGYKYRLSANFQFIKCYPTTRFGAWKSMAEIVNRNLKSGEWKKVIYRELGKGSER